MTNSMPRVFLDSNVWFSALYGSANCEKIIRAHIQETITAVISPQVLKESVRNLKEKIPHKLSVFQKLFFSYPPVIVPDPESINADIKDLVDPKDRPILMAAMLSGVDYFITGNIADFQRNKQKKIGNITILTPKEAIKVLGLS